MAEVIIGCRVHPCAEPATVIKVQGCSIMTVCWGHGMRILLRSRCLLQLGTPRASTPQHGAGELSGTASRP